MINKEMPSARLHVSSEIKQERNGNEDKDNLK